MNVFLSNDLKVIDCSSERVLYRKKGSSFWEYNLWTGMETENADLSAVMSKYQFSLAMTVDHNSSYYFYNYPQAGAYLVQSGAAANNMLLINEVSSVCEANKEIHDEAMKVPPLAEFPPGVFPIVVDYLNYFSLFRLANRPPSRMGDEKKATITFRAM
jgi:hypothetical protein